MDGYDAIVAEDRVWAPWVTHKAVALRTVLLVHLYFFVSTAMLARRHVLTAAIFQVRSMRCGENKA